MTDYTKATNFATKDALVTGDPLKVVKGTEIDDEFNAIEDAIETKANLESPTFTGVPRAPTAATGTSTTQLATTAFVGTALNNLPANSVCSTQIGNNCVTADELNVDGNGTAGQVLISDADGSFSWYSLPGASSNPFISPSATDPTTRDDSSALQEGDIYYNTSSDELRTYDGSSWNAASASYDPTGGASTSGQTSIPIGGLCFLAFSNVAPFNFPNGYGDEHVMLSATGGAAICYYNMDEQGADSSFEINSGTFRLLGGYGSTSPNFLAIRTA